MRLKGVIARTYAKSEFCLTDKEVWLPCISIRAIQ